MSEKVVQGNFKTFHLWSKKRVFIAGATVLVLLAIGSGLYTYSHHRSQSNAHAAMLSQNQKLLDKADYQLAKLKLQEYLATNPPSGYKRDASVQLASAYANAGDLPKALQWYKSTAKLDKNPQLDTVVGLAYTYQALKDKQQAATYFRQAITLEQQSNAPDKDSAVAMYQYLMKQMGGSV